MPSASDDYRKFLSGEAPVAGPRARPPAERAVEHYENGVRLARQGAYPLALAEFDLVLAARPAFPRALNNRGYVRTALRDFAGAIDDLTKALRLCDFAEAMSNRGLRGSPWKRFEERS